MHNQMPVTTSVKHTCCSGRLNVLQVLEHHHLFGLRFLAFNLKTTHVNILRHQRNKPLTVSNSDKDTCIIIFHSTALTARDRGTVLTILPLISWK